MLASLSAEYRRRLSDEGSANGSDSNIPGSDDAFPLLLEEAKDLNTIEARQDEAEEGRRMRAKVSNMISAGFCIFGLGTSLFYFEKPTAAPLVLGPFIIIAGCIFRYFAKPCSGESFFASLINNAAYEKTQGQTRFATIFWDNKTKDVGQAQLFPEASAEENSGYSALDIDDSDDEAPDTNEDKGEPLNTAQQDFIPSNLSEEGSTANRWFSSAHSDRRNISPSVHADLANNNVANDKVNGFSYQQLG